VAKDLEQLVGDDAQLKDNFVRDIKQALAVPEAPTPVHPLSHNSYIKSLSGQNTWSNREIEWYVSEERMLFSCLSEEEADRWVLVLNWLKSKKGQADQKQHELSAQKQKKGWIF
jgi:hypothetical protein